MPIYPGLIYETADGHLIVYKLDEAAIEIVVTIVKEEERDVIRLALSKYEAGKLIEMLARLGIKPEE